MKHIYIATALAIVLSAYTSGPAGARDIAICGESGGQSFYPKLGMLPANENKWVSDGVAGGRITLTETTEGEFDILYTNAFGAVGSAGNDGAIVAPLGLAGDSLGVLVAYPEIGQVETYAFFVNADGKAQVMWTVNRYGPLVRKVSAFTADCALFKP